MGYTPRADLYEAIIEALRASGKPLEALAIEDLAPVDHFHARGLPATVELADRLPVAPGAFLVDIGCGLGGPARYMAKRFGCRVMGADLTERFVAAGNRLSELLGMRPQVELQAGDALALPYADGTFDAGYSQHVTMNIRDRRRFWAEAARVLKPGAAFALTEHGLGSGVAPHFPVPWSGDGSGSFLVAPEETARIAGEAGFEAIRIEEVGEKYVAGYRKGQQRAAAGEPALGIHLLLGPGARERSANAMRNIEEGRTRPFQLFCRKRSA
jgi:SAM-dependent methyltransferase